MTARLAALPASTEADPAETGERLLRSRLAFSPAEAALVCGVSRDAIDDAIRRHQLVAIKAGARVLIGRAQLESWLAGGVCLVPGPAGPASAS